MYCTNCGKEIPDNSKVCDNCGKVLKDITLLIKEEDCDSDTAQNIETNKESKDIDAVKKNKKIFGILVAFVCLSVFIVIAVCVSNNKEEKDSEDTLNEVTINEVTTYSIPTIDDDYNKMIELTKNGEYSEALNLYKSTDLSADFEGYSDSKKYMFYCEAMLYYANGCCGDALKLLEKHCSGMLEADKYITEIHNKVDQFEGIYKSVSPRGVTFLICIHNGQVSSEVGGEIKDEVYYIYNIMEYTFTTGKKAYGFGPGSFSEKKDPDYLFISQEDYSKEFTAISFETNDSKIFNGVYEKISNNPPKEAGI